MRSPGILRMHCARRRRRADAMTQTPDTKPGNYYVSIVRGKDHRLLAGPFVNNHAGALAMVDAARDLAPEIDPRTCFHAVERKGVVEGKGVAVRVVPGGRRH